MALALALSVVGSLLDSVTLVTLVPLLRQLFGTAAEIPAGNTALERWIEGLTAPILAGATAEQALARMVLVLAGGVLLKNAATYVGQQLSVQVQERVVADLRARLFGHLLRMDLDFFRQARTGELVTMVMQETGTVKNVVTATFLALVRNGVLILGTLAVLVAISPRLTLVTVIALPPVMVGLRALIKRLRHHTRVRTAENAAIAGRVSERLASIRLVRTSGQEAGEAEAFGRMARAFGRKVQRTQRFATLTSPVTELFGTVSIILILYAGTHPQWLGLAEPLSPQVILVFLMASLRLTSPFKGLSKVQADWAQAMASLERVNAVLDRPVAETDPPGAREATFREALEVDGVTFAYPGGGTVLRDVSFRLEPGRTVALVGPSGGGKSTLADLVPRLREPTAGELRFDGVPARECSYASVRRLVATVSQETLILHDTVHANVAYGVPGATREQVERAARAANAHEFVAALPEGYDTVLGERGGRLSGGQRQRIAIARALLRDAPILVLDEATSALDPESERLVQEAIERLMEGRAVLVIAHRLATVRRADEILVLEGGRIVQRGTHGSLLAQGGAYRRLHELQFRDAAEPAAGGVGA